MGAAQIDANVDLEPLEIDGGAVTLAQHGAGGALQFLPVESTVLDPVRGDAKRCKENTMSKDHLLAMLLGAGLVVVGVMLQGVVGRNAPYYVGAPVPDGGHVAFVNQEGKLLVVQGLSTVGIKCYSSKIWDQN